MVGPVGGHVKSSNNGFVQQVMRAHDHREPPSLDAPMPLKAQEQGVSGKKVQHKDGETATGDWQKEFGPKGPQASTEKPTTEKSTEKPKEKPTEAPAPPKPKTEKSMSTLASAIDSGAILLVAAVTLATLS